MQSHITLTQLQLHIKDSLRGIFKYPIWVSAEVAECKVNYSGHCYLELIEKGGDNGVPTSQVRAVIWRSAYSTIASQFHAETGQNIGAGIKILAKVNVTYHELYGLSLQIVAIDPAYTLGDMERQRQLTISQLKKDGVWEMNGEIEIPMAPQRIAVISSANAAGYRDFVMELERSPYRIETTLYDAFMQGDAAEESIISAMEAIADSMESYDAVVMIRGGGSSSDLNCFNSYRLCSHVAQFPLPIITGIGHDKDVSVADMVAHTSLKTPTAVAGWLIEQATNLDANLNYLSQQLHDTVRNQIVEQRSGLDNILNEIKHSAKGMATQQLFTIENLERRLRDDARSYIENNFMRLDNAHSIVESNSPQRIMQLGFAIVRGDDGIVMSAKDIKKGDLMKIELRDGVVTTEVKKRIITDKQL